MGDEPGLESPSWSIPLASAFDAMRAANAADGDWIGSLDLPDRTAELVLDRLRARSAEWLIAHFDLLARAEVDDAVDGGEDSASGVALERTRT